MVFSKHYLFLFETRKWLLSKINKLFSDGRTSRLLQISAYDYFPPLDNSIVMPYGRFKKKVDFENTEFWNSFAAIVLHDFELCDSDKKLLKTFSRIMKHYETQNVVITANCRQFVNLNSRLRHKLFKRNFAVFNEYDGHAKYEESGYFIVPDVDVLSRRESMRFAWKLCGSGGKDSLVMTTNICPISKLKMKTPVRGQFCQHVQCFDMDNYIKQSEQRGHGRCPCCMRNIKPPEKLVIDEYAFANIGKQLILYQFRDSDAVRRSVSMPNFVSC